MIKGRKNKEVIEFLPDKAMILLPYRHGLNLRNIFFQNFIFILLANNSEPLAFQNFNHHSNNNQFNKILGERFKMSSCIPILTRFNQEVITKFQIIADTWTQK